MSSTTTIVNVNMEPYKGMATGCAIAVSGFEGDNGVDCSKVQITNAQIIVNGISYPDSGWQSVDEWSDLRKLPTAFHVVCFPQPIMVDTATTVSTVQFSQYQYCTFIFTGRFLTSGCAQTRDHSNKKKSQIIGISIGAVVIVLVIIGILLYVFRSQVFSSHMNQ